MSGGNANGRGWQAARAPMPQAPALAARTRSGGARPRDAQARDEEARCHTDTSLQRQHVPTVMTDRPPRSSAGTGSHQQRAESACVAHSSSNGCRTARRHCASCRADRLGAWKALVPAGLSSAGLWLADRAPGQVQPPLSRCRLCLSRAAK